MFLDEKKMILNKCDVLQFEPFDAWRFDNEQTFWCICGRLSCHLV